MEGQKLQQLSLLEIIEAIESSVTHGEFPFEVYNHHGSAYAVNDRIARTLSVEEMKQTIVIWYRELVAQDPNLAEAYQKLKLDWNVTTVARSLITHSTPLKAQPPALVEGDDNQIAFARLDFIVKPISHEEFAEKAPVTAELLSRMDKPERFASFIAKVVTNRNRKQALWLWGDADAYKSTYIEIIGSVFKGAYANFQSQHFDPSYQWLEAELEGKRLIQCDEAKPEVVEHDKFKMLTGASQVMANVKYGHPKHVRLECHFVFTSNKPPTASREAALKARLLPVHIQGKPDNSFSYHERVRAYRNELRHLVCYGASCLLEHSHLRLDANEQGAMMHPTAHGDLTEIISTHFTFDPLGYVLASDFSTILKNHGITSRGDKSAVLDQLKAICNLKNVTVRNAENRVCKAYQGISLKFRKISD